MEKLKSLSEVTCPLHPSFPIQLVHMEESSDKQFLCSQCLLEFQDFSMIAKVKSIAELIEKISKINLEKKESVQFHQKPAEYLDLLSGQAEVMEKLNRQIEDEKKKTSIFFDLMAQEIIKIIRETKEQYLKELDEQVDRLRSHLAHFERQLKKAYPTDEDLPSLFPCKEVLEKRFQSLNDLDHLKTFVRDLKKDLKEAEFFGINQLGSVYQDELKQLYEHIGKVKENKPHYIQDDQILLEFNNRLRDDITGFIKSQVKLENRIGEFSSWKDSKIVTKQELYMIKNWLPADQRFNPRLIYRSSRDGDEGASFHKLCDGKNNTISLLKVIFDGSDKPCIIGGFLDAPWNSQKRNFIHSQNAFIFSITKNIKCLLNASHHGYAAGADGNRFGPVFGGGPDLLTPIHNKGYVCPKSYTGTEQLVQSNSYAGSGKIEFQTVEVEVYSLD